MKHTKAGMFNYLKNNLPSIKILPVMIVNSNEFYAHEYRTIEAVLKFAEGCLLAIRSSSSIEDTQTVRMLESLSRF